MTYYETVLKRYLQPGESTIQDVYKRTAHAFCHQPYDLQENELFELFNTGSLLPNSPALANAGSTRGGYSACYVLPLEDSIHGIYKSMYHQAVIHAAFGGTGFDFSKIRPSGSSISSTGGEACGPCAILELLNQSAHTIRQGGKREGANMGILRDDHPDLDKFICYKDNKPYIKHFNISVGIQNRTIGTHAGNDLIHHIAEHSYATGDPGIVFIDRLNANNKFIEELGPINATNPCGEQPLRPYECCNLASFNLSRCVENGEVDFDRIQHLTNVGIRLLDHIININNYPLDEIRYATMRSRKTGLGIMGWADMLISLGIPYGSSSAITLIHEIGKTIQETAHNVSEELGDIFGDHEFGTRRNETLLTIAPTGTLSFFAGCSSGIEPNFKWRYIRETEAGQVEITHPMYNSIIGSDMENDLAHLIPPKVQLSHQAAWQQYIDNAVSKTVNLPSTSTVEDIEEILHMAVNMECKGITIYRDKSKKQQVLNDVDTPIFNIPRERPAVVHERKSGCGTIYVIPSIIQGRPWDCFIETSGGCAALSEALGRLISGWVQDPIPNCGVEKRIMSILHTVDCSNCNKEGTDGKSCADIIGQVILSHWIKEKQSKKVLCPSCHQELNFGSGCSQGECPSCGWSGCN